MTTDDTTIAIENAAAHRRVTATSLETALGTRDAAKAALVAAAGYQEAGRNAKAKLSVLRAEDDLDVATQRAEECERIHRAADTMWATLVRRAYADRHRGRLQAWARTAQALEAEFTEDLADRAAMAQALGVADSGEHPVQAARQLVHAIQYAQRVLDPPAPSVSAPRPGMTRVRVLKPHWNHDVRYGIPFAVDNVYDLRTDQLPEATAGGLVEPVEA